MRSHSEVTGDRTSTYKFEGDISQPTTVSLLLISPTDTQSGTGVTPEASVFSGLTTSSFLPASSSLEVSSEHTLLRQ